MNRSTIYVPRAAFLTAALILALSALPRPLSADDIRVDATVESRDVYVGESFLYQITVDGSSEAVEPDVSGLKGFSVEYLGGSNNSSTSISIINGRVQRTEKKGFVFTYRLTPLDPGRTVIPAVDVSVEGTVFATDPVTISVKKPEESDDFKLRISLSRESVFVGEPAVLTVTWYLGRDVESFSFTAPVLSSDAFDFELPEVRIDQSRKYYRIPVNGTEVIAEKGQGMLDGEKYVTLSFRLALIPMRSGVFDIPEFIVACESGSGTQGRRDLFDEFFSDGFRGRWRGSVKKYVVPSNTLSIEVKELPLEGRPEGFAGHVGELEVSTVADPLVVNVGDPITLEIVIEGPDYLGRFELPELSSQPDLARDFRIPDERADGEVKGSRKIFTQTLRALSEQVTEIPPIRISYFDTGKEQYMVAASDPIPIEVRPTRVVTASDAEGLAQGPGGSPLEKWKEGIAYNYEGPEVLEDQGGGLESIYRNDIVLSTVIAYPLLFLLVLLVREIASRRSSDPARVRARGALKRLRSRLGGVAGAGTAESVEFSRALMDALKEYLGDKLGRSGAALTAGEVERLLEERDVQESTVKAVKEVFEECEMWSYSGTADSAETRKGLSGRVLDAARSLDREL